MWTDSLGPILSDLDAAGIPLSFIYGGTRYDSLPSDWEVIRDERTDDEDRVRLVRVVRDPQTGLSVEAEANVYGAVPALEWVLHFENTGSGDTPIIEDIQALDAALPTNRQEAVVLHQIEGDTCSAESFRPFDSELNDGDETSIQPKAGRPSDPHFPFINLAHAGQGMMVAIGWSGQWKASYSREDGESLAVQAGLERTHLALHPGERIRTPRMLLMPWTGDRREAHNRFRQLMIAHYSPRNGGRFVNAPLAENNYDVYSRTPGWATEAGQLDFVERVAKCGIETYWLDAAWFPGGFPHGVGNWSARPEDFPRGLKPISDAAHRHGMRFQVWFEPGRVGDESEIMRDHPEWVMSVSDGQRRLFNWGDPEAREWMTNRIGSRLNEWSIDTFREDYNIDPLPFWRNADTPDRVGMAEITWVEGHYQFWDDLRATRPNLVIDNCSSGGRRIDLETCMRAIPMWRSDTSCGAGHADWDQRQTIGLSQFIPLHMACTHSVQTYDTRSSATYGSISQFPLYDEDFRYYQARRAMAETWTNRPYWLGDFYPLTEASVEPEDWTAFQFHRSDWDAGIVLAFRHSESADASLTVPLGGVDPNVRYTVTFIDEARNVTRRACSSGELSSGLELNIPQRRASLLVRYERTA